MEKCSNCPIKDKCIAEITNHKQYCRWVESRDKAKIDRVIELSNKEYPSITTQIINVVSSVGRIVDDAIHGKQILVSEEEKINRLNICRECEWFESENERCKKCGCWLAIKTYMKSEHCPINKW